MGEARDLIERALLEPVDRKGDGWWFLLESLVETHRMLARDDSDNQMAPIPAEDLPVDPNELSAKRCEPDYAH